MNPRLILGSLITATCLVAPAWAADNTLTAAEKAAGWELLFDGKTTTGWRGYRQEGMPKEGWTVADGMLQTVAKVKGGELVTTRRFKDFELTWDWRVEEGGNNGVKYFVSEDRPKAPGHEYQMLDDERHPDGKIGPKRQTAAFYDVLPPAADKPKRPGGEWNSSRLLVQGDHVEHWLNGKLVLAYDLGSPAVKAGLAASKFKGFPDFGTKINGPIMLTYHQDRCWYKNVKVRELK